MKTLVNEVIIWDCDTNIKKMRVISNNIQSMDDISPLNNEELGLISRDEETSVIEGDK